MIDNRRVYCHKTFIDNTLPQEGFVEENWYLIYYETSKFYAIQHSEHSSLIRNFRFYKELDLNGYIFTNKVFSEFFYTEEEYRDKQIDKILI